MLFSLWSNTVIKTISNSWMITYSSLRLMSSPSSSRPRQRSFSSTRSLAEWNRSTVRRRRRPKEICPAEILVEIILSQGIMGYNSRDDLPLRCNIGFPRCGSKLCLKKCVLALPRPCSIAMRGAWRGGWGRHQREKVGENQVEHTDCTRKIPSYMCCTGQWHLRKQHRANCKMVERIREMLIPNWSRTN